MIIRSGCGSSLGRKKYSFVSRPVRERRQDLQGAKVSQMWQNAATFAAGLRVPKPYGDSIMLEILRESGGVALAVSDEQILASLADWARHEGIFLSPEGAAATASYDHLIATGFLKSKDRVELFNTGGGLKYTDVTAEAMGLQRPAPQA